MYSFHFFCHNPILVRGYVALRHVLAYDLPLRSYTVFQGLFLVFNLTLLCLSTLLIFSISPGTAFLEPLTRFHSFFIQQPSNAYSPYVRFD